MSQEFIKYTADDSYCLTSQIALQEKNIGTRIELVLVKTHVKSAGTNIEAFNPTIITHFF